MTQFDIPGNSTEATGIASTEASVVWSPLTIGPVPVKNRIMMTAMTLGYADDNLLSDRHIAYYAERARGGVALMVTEQQAGHRLSKGSFAMGCTAWEKRVIPQYEKLADAVHEFGAKQFVQLFGCGVHDKGTMIFDEWHPLWAASRLPSIVHHEIPMEMESHHIAEVAKAFGEAALNVKIAGLDGVEVQGSHSYLVGQFLSRAYNLRSDEYGGSVANRCRFALELGERIRDAVGDSIAVGIRISLDEFLGDAGITSDEGDEHVGIFAASGLFDYLSITGGGYHTIHRVTPTGTRMPEGFLVPLAKRAKEIVGDRAKIFTVGRIRDIRMAERIVASGAADMVGMTRAHVADPHLVSKTQAGREDSVVHCVYANACQTRLWDQRPVACVVNPVAGREQYWGHGSLRGVDGASRKIAVVGGGPVGMKVAALASTRGHSVTLYEREGTLGGHLETLRQLPTRETWGDAISDLSRRLIQSHVEVRLGADASATMLVDDGYETIVCATGSHWDSSGLSPYRPDRKSIPGTAQGHVLDLGTALTRALRDPQMLGDSVLIVDDSGSYLPLGFAELLTRAGIKVEIVSPRLFVGEETLKAGDMAYLLPYLKEHGVRFFAQHFVEEIGSDSVEVYDIWNPREWFRLRPTHVVLAMMRVPNDELYYALRTETSSDIHRVGDALAPRALEAVMYEGEKFGRGI